MEEGDQPKANHQPRAPLGSWAAEFPRIATIVLIVAVFVALMALFWYSIHVLLVAFGGILFAIFLRTLADALNRLTGIGRTISLAVVVVALLVIVAAAAVLMTPYIIAQIEEMRRLIPQAVEDVRQQIAQYAWGDFLLNRVPATTDIANAPVELWLGAFGALGWVVSAITGLLVILFLGIYLAADPDLYVTGVVHLTPLSYRPQMRELMQRLGYTLRWWLIGQAMAMLFIGIVASIGLYLMGIPLALPLGILSGLLTFVPTFGPIVGSILPLLLAFSISPWLVVSVLIFYVLIEHFESLVLSPMIQQRVVHLPKAVAITAQILMLLLVGPLGLIFGHPLAAAGKVVVQQFYVRDTLGDRSLDITGG